MVGVILEITKSVRESITVRRVSFSTDDQYRLNNHCDALATARPKCLVRVGKISATYTHGRGPELMVTSEAREKSKKNLEHTPSHRIETDVYIKHGRHGLRGRWGGGRWHSRNRMRLQNCANDVEEGSHSESGNDQRQLSTKRFDTEGDEESRGDDLDDTYSRITWSPIRR